MAEILLTHGLVTVVDDGDYEWLNQWKWFAEKHGQTWYVKRRQYLGGGRANEKSRSVYMHRVIMGEPVGQVDHEDRNGLNNVRLNLRVATVAQNQFNQGKKSNNTSGYKGVSFCKQTGLWAASIGVTGRKVWLGRHLTPEQAAAAYDEAARKYHGEFARLNREDNGHA